MPSVLRVSGIYRIMCKANGLFYIGSSKNIHHRWIVHRCELNTRKHKNGHLQNAWDKYGESSFEIEVLEVVDQSALIEREQHYLDTLKPFGVNGFNLAIKADAGLSGRKLSDETKSKMSASKKGIPMKDAQKALLSKSLTGRKLSDEHVSKIRKALSERQIKPETRAKLSQAKKGRVVSDKAKQLLSKDYIVTSPDGTEYLVHGLKQFCNEHGLHYKVICGLVHRKSKTRTGWKCRKVE